MTMNKKTISVEVAFALPTKQCIVECQVPEGCTAEEAVIRSGISGQFTNYAWPDVAELKLGVFGKSVRHDTVLRNKDRVEIYRPLIADPKAVRRQRAEAGKVMRKGGGDESA